MTPTLGGIYGLLVCFVCCEIWEVDGGFAGGVAKDFVNCCGRWRIPVPTPRCQTDSRAGGPAWVWAVSVGVSRAGSPIPEHLR